MLPRVESVKRYRQIALTTVCLRASRLWISVKISDGFLWRDGSKLNPSQQGTMWMMTLPPWQGQLQSFRLFIFRLERSLELPICFPFQAREISSITNQ